MTAATKLAIIVGIFIAVLLGWAVDGYGSAAVGLVIGTAIGVVRWRGQPLWSWLISWLRRRRPITWSEPLTVANDRAGGGVRYQDGVAVAAVQLLGKPHTPTLFTGSTSTYTENAFDITDLKSLLRQSLGLRIGSLSVVSAGARRRSTGDYPRVYDTLIGTPPYAGQRETWLIVRTSALDNVEALRERTSVGTATVAAAQRICAAMRQKGIRAKVATATDIVEMERRLGRSALEVSNRRWRSVRGDSGWLTTYWYSPGDITAEKLAQVWRRAPTGSSRNHAFRRRQCHCHRDGAYRQQPTAPPSTMLRTLPGEQAHAIAANLCGSLPALRASVAERCTVRCWSRSGRRVCCSARSPGKPDAAALGRRGGVQPGTHRRGGRIGQAVRNPHGRGRRADQVHTRNMQRWATVRMPDIGVSDQSKPISGTTVSVVDGTLTPAPRPRH